LGFNAAAGFRPAFVFSFAIAILLTSALAP